MARHFFWAAQLEGGLLSSIDLVELWFPGHRAWNASYQKP
jgi:hypothetical protein